MATAEQNRSKAEIMARLFDIDVDNNLDLDSASDYGTSESSVNVPFEVQCENMKKNMQHEANIEDLDPFEADEPVSQPVAPPVQQQPSVAKEEKTTAKTTKPKGKKAEAKSVVEVPPVESVVPTMVAPSDNPMLFEQEILDIYKTIISKYPHFKIQETDLSFQVFYIRKVQMLSHILSKFPLLNIEAMRQEVRGTDLNHYLGEGNIHPDLIALKLDNTYKCRTRIVSLLTEAHYQHHVWRKCSEMLSSKLWHDHESRGAHKRDSLVLDHMREISLYIEEMEGFIQSATAIDNLLKAAADSLSRQLSCMQVKQSSGLHGQHGYTHKNLNTAPENNTLDDLESLDVGTVVPKPTSMGPVVETWGLKNTDDYDPIMDIG